MVGPTFLLPKGIDHVVTERLIFLLPTHFQIVNDTNIASEVAHDEHTFKKFWILKRCKNLCSVNSGHIDQGVGNRKFNKHIT